LDVSLRIPRATARGSTISGGASANFRYYVDTHTHTHIETFLYPHTCTRAQTHGRSLTEKRKVRASLARLGWLHCGSLSFAARTFRKLPWCRRGEKRDRPVARQNMHSAQPGTGCAKKKNHRMSYSVERDPIVRYAESIFPSRRKCGGVSRFSSDRRYERVVLKEREEVPSSLLRKYFYNNINIFINIFNIALLSGLIGKVQ